MLLPGRHGSVDSYRYGFQGQEKDDEIKGEANSINYKFRMHDPRLGRFFAVDPLMHEYPNISPYTFSENRVINTVDREGLESTFYILTLQELDGVEYLVPKQAFEIEHSITLIGGKKNAFRKVKQRIYLWYRWQMA